MSTERLRLESVSFERGDRRVIDRVSLRVAAGDWVTLLGPNGAGKTTLIKLVTGQLRPGAGTRWVADAPERSHGASRIGLVPQEPALFDALDVTGNLAAFARLHGVAAGVSAQRVRRALAWSGLRPHAGQRIAALSGGMVRRLNIACATLHDPSLLVLDEPTVGVDPHAREHIYDMLLALQRRGTALLYTTHLFDEAERFSSQIAVLDRGRVIAAGTPEAVRRQAGLDAATVRIDVPRDAPDVTLPGLHRSANAYVGALVDPARELPRLLAMLAAAGVDFERVSCGTTGLDAAYFALTGRSLRA
jgi:ABC-2 type transport system ATP-binding protein